MKTFLKSFLLAGVVTLCGFASAANYVGDFAPGDVVDCVFGTVRPSTGASFTLAGSPAVSAYKDNSTTQSTSGVTLTADFDSVTGMNHVRVTTASDGSFYSPNSTINLVITAGTVDSVSVTGQPVCAFSLRKVNLGQVVRGTLSGTHSSTTADLGTNAPGATSQVAGMTLVVPAKVFSVVVTSYDTGTGVATFPTTSLTLTDGDYWELWPTPSSTFANDSITNNVLANSAVAEIQSGLAGASDQTAIKTKTDFLPSATAGAAGGLFIAGTNAATTVSTAFTTTFTGNLTGNVGGNVTGSVGSVAAGGITNGSFAADAISASKINADVATEFWSLTCSEPTAKPSWGSSTLNQWMCWTSAWTRNKVTQTSTTKTLRNDADSGNLVTCTVSDDSTTFTLNECTP